MILVATGPGKQQYSKDILCTQRSVIHLAKTIAAAAPAGTFVLRANPQPLVKLVELGLTDTTSTSKRAGAGRRHTTNSFGKNGARRRKRGCR
jgi:hypothetical protein